MEKWSKPFLDSTGKIAGQLHGACYSSASVLLDTVLFNVSLLIA